MFTIIIILIFKVAFGDGLPEGVCPNCSKLIENAYILKLQCEQTDNTLRKYLNEGNCNMNPLVKQNGQIFDDQLDNHSLDDFQDNTDTFSEACSMDKLENIEPVPNGRMINSCEEKDSNENLNNHCLEKTHECNSCKKMFLSEEELKIHFAAEHEKNSCRVCFSMFNSNSELTQHEKIHKENGTKTKGSNCRDMHVCTVCDERFQESDSLIAHMLREHTEKEVSMVFRKFPEFCKVVFYYYKIL